MVTVRVQTQAREIARVVGHHGQVVEQCGRGDNGVGGLGPEVLPQANGLLHDLSGQLMYPRMADEGARLVVQPGIAGKLTPAEELDLGDDGDVEAPGQHLM